MVTISGGLGTFAPQPVTEIQEGQSPTEHTKVCRRYARCNLPNHVCPCTPIAWGARGTNDGRLSPAMDVIVAEPTIIAKATMSASPPSATAG